MASRIQHVAHQIHVCPSRRQQIHHKILPVCVPLCCILARSRAETFNLGFSYSSIHHPLSDDQKNSKAKVQSPLQNILVQIFMRLFRSSVRLLNGHSQYYWVRIWIRWGLLISQQNQIRLGFSSVYADSGDSYHQHNVLY